MLKGTPSVKPPLKLYFQTLRSTGLRKHDPRMTEFMDQLKQIHREKPVEGTSPETQYLDKEGFKR